MLRQFEGRKARPYAQDREKKSGHYGWCRAAKGEGGYREGIEKIAERYNSGQIFRSLMGLLCLSLGKENLKGIEKEILSSKVLQDTKHNQKRQKMKKVPKNWCKNCRRWNGYQCTLEDLDPCDKVQRQKSYLLAVFFAICAILLMIFANKLS